MRWATVKRTGLVLWTALSAILGGVLVVWLLEYRFESIGYGCEGPRDFLFYAGIGFTVGASVNAYRAYRRFRFGPDGWCDVLESGLGSKVMNTFFVTVVLPWLASLLWGSLGAYLGFIVGVVLSIWLFFVRKVRV
jgi:hypothetical protein